MDIGLSLRWCRMIVGIVGSEEIKFTAVGRAEAQAAIQSILTDEQATEVVSGACHLGGVDAWAAVIGNVMGLRVTEFPPKNRSWETGYKPRNLQIAQRSDVVYCITVKRLPDSYRGMKFALCYHCGTSDHVKSGGCWTMKQAEKLGKRGQLIVVENAE